MREPVMIDPNAPVNKLVERLVQLSGPLMFYTLNDPPTFRTQEANSAWQDFAQNANALGEALKEVMSE